MDIRCAYTELRPIKELKTLFHPQNRNFHPPEQIARLAKILEYQGARSPARISNRSGKITAGHGRVLAAEHAGWESYPVEYQDYKDEAHEIADLNADNAIASWSVLDIAGIGNDIIELGPDFDCEMLGLKDFAIEPAEKLEPGCDEDDVPDTLPEPKVVRGDLFTLGNHRLLCGDSTMIDDVERLMGGKKAELCFTSPPYADQREYNGDKDLSTEHIATFIRSSFNHVNYFAINLGYSRKDGEVNQYWNDYIKEANSCGLKLLSWNIWDKQEAGSVSNQTAMFAICHEWIFVFGANPKELNLTVPNKNSGTLQTHSNVREKNGKLTKRKNHITRDYSQLKTIIAQTPQKARNHGINHPAMFPVEFSERYIEAMTNPNQFVFEPFGGSGSTLIACEKTNRTCFMMELDPHYCGVILDRWQKYSGKKAYREDGVAWDDIKAQAQANTPTENP